MLVYVFKKMPFVVVDIFNRRQRNRLYERSLSESNSQH